MENCIVLFDYNYYFKWSLYIVLQVKVFNKNMLQLFIFHTISTDFIIIFTNFWGKFYCSKLVRNAIHSMKTTNSNLIGGQLMRLEAVGLSVIIW